MQLRTFPCKPPTFKQRLDLHRIFHTPVVEKIVQEPAPLDRFEIFDGFGCVEQ
jgi:hypothetical protein